MAAGVAIGVLAVRKVSKVKSTLGPQGLNRAVGQVGDSISEFAEALRSGMQEREADLKAALGVEVPAPRSEPTTTTVTAGRRAAL
nr:hypothetical protein [Arthrobacter sp. Br18]